MEFKYHEPWLEIELTPEEREQLVKEGTVSEHNGGNGFDFDSTTTVKLTPERKTANGALNGADLVVGLRTPDLPVLISRHAVMGDENLRFGTDGGIIVKAAMSHD